MAADVINDMMKIFQDKKMDLCFSLKEVEDDMRELDARRNTVEGKLSEVEYAIRYLAQNGAEAI